MRIGIDATNIKVGGGLRHLIEVINNVNPDEKILHEIVLWSSLNVLNEVRNEKWLIKKHSPIFEKNLIFRIFWQIFKLNILLKRENCDILFVPGGTFFTKYKPVVSISQNLLPFEKKELNRYKYSILYLKFILLKHFQIQSFKNSSGIIFLSEYAKSVILNSTGKIQAEKTIIPHGINKDIFNHPRKPYKIDIYNNYKKFNIVYISSIEPYKHQHKVLEAVSILLNEKYPIKLSIVGSARKKDLAKLIKKINILFKSKDKVDYIGFVDHKNIKNYYYNSDLFVYASSCENLPIILLEAMASGLPICCSNRGPMPEIIKNAATYFNPEEPKSIANAIRKMIDSPKLREDLSILAYKYAQNYSWNVCSVNTFSFLEKIYNYHNYNISKKIL